MSVGSRPSSRITIGEAYYDLIDSYETVKKQIELDNLRQLANNASEEYSQELNAFEDEFGYEARCKYEEAHL